MPTYDYQCDKCGHTFEEFQSMSDPPRSRCPKCRGRVRRLLGTGGGIVFRGSGWYVTDSRRGSAKGARDAAAKADATASGDAGTKKDASPAGAGDSSKPKG